MLCMELCVMAHLHCRRRTWVQSQIRIRIQMATLYHAKHVYIPQTQIPTPYFCIGQESESESILESVSSNANEP